MQLEHCGLMTPGTSAVEGIRASKPAAHSTLNGELSALAGRSIDERLKRPIPFDAPDRLPVSDILILLVPQQATEEHLRILADAAQMFADSRFRKRLQTCVDPREARQAFADWPDGVAEMEVMGARQALSKKKGPKHAHQLRRLRTWTPMRMFMCLTFSSAPAGSPPPDR